MRDRLRRSRLGDPPEQVPFRFGRRSSERGRHRIAARDGGAHEIGFLREQERIPARLEIRIPARAVRKALVMVDIRENGGGRGAKLERELGERIGVEDIARRQHAEIIDVAARR